jgi:hypothetical protein
MTPQLHNSDASTAARYWVIGGQFCSTEFAQLIPGTERLVGPFGERGSAVAAWRGLSQQHRSECTVRYTVVAEPWL